MNTLLRASEVTKKPVVTFGGEDIAQVKDIVYAANGGEVGGFTLAGRGLFAGPLRTAVPWSAVVGLGPDALIIESEDVVVPDSSVLAGAQRPDEPSNAGADPGDIMGSQVLTDDGTALGTVVDVVLAVNDQPGGQCDVIGYEIAPAESLGRGTNRLLIPLPDTLAASGEHLMVPAAARDFVRDDLAGFGAAVAEFRAHLQGGRR